jgi:hypothetical protein
MRVIYGLIGLIVLLFIVLPVVRYRTADPCRMLAQDIAAENYQQFASAVGAEPGETPEAAEAMARMLTSQYSQTECVMKLKDRWLGIVENGRQ